MIPADPELLYRRFTAHVATCRFCRSAGGERAAAGDLCATGRALLTTWGRAEQAYAALDSARDHAGPDA